MRALSKELLELEEAHVTRYGDECGMPTHEPEINYFCRETRVSMRNLINALNEFHIKLNRWVGYSMVWSKEAIQEVHFCLGVLVQNNENDA